VAAACGIQLDESAERSRSFAVAASTSENTSSMLADVLRGTETEINAINGFVAKEGRNHGISTPYNSTLTALVEGVHVDQATQVASDSEEGTASQKAPLGCSPLVLTSIKAWQKHRFDIKSQYGHGITIGFVPTMGGLHKGHLDLVRAAKDKCDFVVVSIFVNPKQFSEDEHFESYPRNLEDDCAILEGLADAIFAPHASEIYPDDFSTSVSLTPFLHNKAEHTRRPHFFNGVATVVTKLLSAIAADAVFVGQKDGLQCAVIRRLVQDLSLQTEVVVCPTSRELDGLALSTRNQQLSSEERHKAPLLYRSLMQMQHDYIQCTIPPTVADLKASCIQMFDQEPAFSLEYVSCSTLDGAELSDADFVTEDAIDDGVMLSVAAQLGQTRLIDNIIMQKAGLLQRSEAQ